MVRPLSNSARDVPARLEALEQWVHPHLQPDLTILFDVPLKQIEAQEVKPPTEQPGILLTNPPYGERIGVRGDTTIPADEMSVAFYSALGTTLKQRFAGWTVFLFTADLSLPKLLRLKEARKTPFFNGALECRLFRFDMVAGYNRREEAKPKQA